MSIEQIVKIDFPYKQEVTVYQIQSEESISAPYLYTVTLISELSNLSAEKIIGKPVHISIIGELQTKYLNGFTNTFRLNGKSKDTGHYLYELSIRPQLFFLEKSKKCRIFQNKSPIDIIKAVLSENSIQNIVFKLDSEKYEKYEYKVQFEESDFIFISRILEHEGIFYYFEQKSDGYELIFGDSVSSYTKCLTDTLDYQEKNLGHDYISEISFEKNFQLGKTSFTSYDLNKPKSNLKISKKLSGNVPKISKGISEEAFDYHEDVLDYQSRTKGEHQGKIRLEQFRAGTFKVYGKSNSRSIEPGFWFNLKAPAVPETNNKQWLVTSVNWHFNSNQLQLASSEESGTFQNYFECIPKEYPFKPLKVNRKNKIIGLQTATVVGPSDKEVYSKDYSRIKVQFHWDREGKNNENSTCWIRVSQGFAGSNFGVFFQPRIGHEVIVGFLGGNPDKPIILGSLYNGENQTPYKLPANQNRSGIRTHTIEGSAKDFNEISFEDSKNKEEFYIKAQKDHKIEVGNNESRKIVKDLKLDVGNERTEETKATYKNTIKENYILKVDQKNTNTIGSNRETKISGNDNVNINGNRTLEANGNISIVSNANLNIDAKSITINCGGVSIKMLPGLIQLSGLVKINGQTFLG